MFEYLGLENWYDDNHPPVEAVIAILLLALNTYTKYPVDDNGFSVVDDSQAIVSPSTEPRRSFVTRNGQKQIKTTLIFDVYSDDNSALNPDLIVKRNEDSTSSSPAE